jgi:hypothetical protein
MVEGFTMEPYKVEIRGISEELHREKGRAQKTAQPLQGSKNSFIANKAFGIVQEVEDLSHWGQKRVYKLFRRLGVAQEGKENSKFESKLSSHFEAVFMTYISNCRKTSGFLNILFRRTQNINFLSIPHEIKNLS